MEQNGALAIKMGLNKEIAGQQEVVYNDLVTKR